MRQTELLDEPITTEKDHDVSRIKVGEVISGKVYDARSRRFENLAY
jgi:hypothetical protein